MIQHYKQFFLVFVLIFISLILTLENDLTRIYAITLLIIFTLILVLFLFIIWKQPQNTNIQTFKIPFVPFFPMISIFINIYLMMSLTLYTWIRFFVWFIIGFAIYFSYSIRFSKENKVLLSWCPFVERDVPMDDVKMIEKKPVEINL